MMYSIGFNDKRSNNRGDPVIESPSYNVHILVS